MIVAAASYFALTAAVRAVLFFTVVFLVHVLVPHQSAVHVVSALSPLSCDTMEVVSLTRFPVKGLGPSLLDSVHIQGSGETFPDDRRFALLKKVNVDKFDSANPEWLFKGNFLCAFTAPELMARYECEYRIIEAGGSSSDEERGSSGTHNVRCRQSCGAPWDDVDGASKRNTNTKIQRLLTVWERDENGKSQKASSSPVLGPVDLATDLGKEETGAFFSQKIGEDVVCVTAKQAQSKVSDSRSITAHNHQFGNTSSGVKANGNTRTVHIINAETVRQFSDAIGIPLNPSRFRPNVVVSSLEPWAEFDMIGKTLVLEQNGSSNDDNESSELLTLDIVSKTVRCEGVGIDPDDAQTGVLPIPSLLTEHFPERGPYLGVYAIVRTGGTLRLGDRLQCRELLKQA
mmetsp:Transcript_22896/g.50856  ORF Transcript_22896/g.50856 Transcript_22896/m.50856 type:complete len:401 (+) Transcript_22896:91-1293(+)